MIDDEVLREKAAWAAYVRCIKRRIADLRVAGHEPEVSAPDVLSIALFNVWRAARQARDGR